MERPARHLGGELLPEHLLRIALHVDGVPQRSETSVERLCAYGITFTTTLLAAELGVELCSEYVGYADSSARSSHLAVCRERPETEWTTAQHPARALDVRGSPRTCLYDHLHRLQDFLGKLGHTVTADLDEGSLARLDPAGPGPARTAAPQTGSSASGAPAP
jgi:hypothetical protein